MMSVRMSSELLLKLLGPFFHGPMQPWIENSAWPLFTNWKVASKIGRAIRLSILETSCYMGTSPFSKEMDRNKWSGRFVIFVDSVLKELNFADM